MTAVLEVQAVEAVAPMPKRSPLHTRPVPGHKAAERLVLTGFMGSGKSTTGRLLADEMGWTFLDLDSVIEQRAGMTVAQIFAERGEEAFRKEETAALAFALRGARVVVALGGGAPETLTNRLLLEQTPATMVVYLAAPFEVLQSRCDRQAADPASAVRPVFSDFAVAQARFAERQPLYARLAHLTVDTSDQTPHETTAAIAAAVLANQIRA